MQHFNEKNNREVCPKSRKHSKAAGRYRWARFFLPITGVFALIWFLIRVIPKPSRATYPCQRVAFPLASTFVIWLMGLGGSVAAIRKAKVSFAKARPLLAAVCILVSVGSIWVAVNVTADKLASATTPPLRAPQAANAPIGVGRGIHPGRVVWIHDPNVSNWDGSSNYWWSSGYTDQTTANDMMSRAIRALAGTSAIDHAWDMIFHHFNQETGRGDVGYSAGEKVTIKVNYVYHWGGSGPTYSSQSNQFDSSPQMIYALLDQLVNVVGVSQADITVGDPLDTFANCFYNYLSATFPSVHYLDAFGQYSRTQATPSNVRMYWSTPDAADKINDYVPQQYVDATYFIDLGTLKGHYNQGGITVCGKNHYGSIMSGSLIGTTGRYARKPDGDGNFYNLHSGLLDSAVGGHPAMGYYRPLVDIMGHPHIGGKTMLYLVDGLYAAKHVAGNTPVKWYLSPFSVDGNPDWTSSMFASMDPVAIDSVAFDFLYAEWPETWGPASEGVDDYMHEAALADDPPSGSFYDPDGDGTGLGSLGVHEHWNNSTDKQYSRNLDPVNGTGIELVTSPPEGVAGDYDGDEDVDLVDYAMLAAGWPAVYGIDELAELCYNWLQFGPPVPPVTVYDGDFILPWISQSTGGSQHNLPFEDTVAPDATDAAWADIWPGDAWRWTRISTDGSSTGLGENTYLEFDLYFDTTSAPGHRFSAMHMQVDGDGGWNYKWENETVCWVNGVEMTMADGPDEDLEFAGNQWHHVKIDLTTNVYSDNTGGGGTITGPNDFPPGDDTQVGLIRLCFGHDTANGADAYIKNVEFTASNVLNNAPIVNAGPDQLISLPDLDADLDGTVTDDGRPVPPGAVSVLWEQVGGAGTATFGDATQVDTTVTFSGAGIYTLRLTADDGELTASDTVTITVASQYDITFDNHSWVSSLTSGTTLSWSHTVGSGNNRMLVVGFAGESNTLGDLSITGVTYGGTPMSLVDGSSHYAVSGTTVTYMKTDLYYLSSPPTGTASIVITLAGSVTYKGAGAVSLFNVSQGPAEAVATNDNVGQVSISTNITVPTSGSWLVDVVGSGNTGTFTPGAGMTEEWEWDVGGTTSSAGSTRATAGGVVTNTWSNSGANRLSHSVAAFAPAQ